MSVQAPQLITIKGPGVFVGGHVAKQGGASDLTFVSLDIDGRNVVNASYAAVRNTGLTQDNPYGLVVLPSSPGAQDNMAFGFPEPLRYEKQLVLTATVKEDGVAQLHAEVVHGSA